MKEKTKILSSYLALVAVFILIICVGFYLYKIRTPFPVITKVGNSTFEILEFQLCDEKNANRKNIKANLFLVSVEQPNEKAIIKYLNQFNSPHHCDSFIFFQEGKMINKNWESLITLKSSDIHFPDNYFAFSYLEKGDIEEGGYSLMDLANGKAHGKFRRYFEGKLYLEREVINNITEGKGVIYHEGYKIVEVWKNNKCILADTIKD